LRKKVFAANWKMNMTLSETKSYFRRFLNEIEDIPASACDVIICPPAILIPQAVAQSDDSSVAIGAQNIHWEEEGAYTGEISAKMVRDSGAEYCICGHSERRQIFEESSEMVTHKAIQALENRLIPILCVGETLFQRDNEETLEVISGQLLASLAGIDETEDIILAYEPVWAIGTGVSAEPRDAQEAIAYMRNIVREQWGDLADDIRILYGGSIKPSNVAAFMACPDIDGVLVGGASLDARDFAEIIQAGLKA